MSERNRVLMFGAILLGAYLLLSRNGSTGQTSVPVDPTTGLPITVGADYGSSLANLRQQIDQGGFI